MLDCSEQDGASGDAEEKTRRRAGAFFSRGDGLGIVTRARRDSDGISQEMPPAAWGWDEGAIRNNVWGRGGELR